MYFALNHLIHAVRSIWYSVLETKDQKYRRDMMKFLNQAVDRLHLEQLEREWEKMHGRKYW